jgi:hypothetical protein
MAALTQDTMRRRKGAITFQTYKLAADAVIYYNALVSVGADGFLIPAADTASTAVVGVADEAADNTGGADGDLEIRVYRGAALFATSGANAIVQANVGGDAVVLDDNTVVAAAGATNDIVAGEVLEVESATAVWINVAGKR